MSESSGFAVCVGGVPGAGKTTLLQTHVERAPADEQITGSSIVKAIIAPATVQELDAWEPERRAEVRAESIRRLVLQRARCRGRLLIDGHFTLRNRASGIIEPIFTPEDEAFFGALVLVDSSPEAVLAQRIADGRDRGNDALDAIAQHLQHERAEGRRLAAHMRVPLLEIVSPDGAERLRQLAAFLEGLR